MTVAWKMAKAKAIIWPGKSCLWRIGSTAIHAELSGQQSQRERASERERERERARDSEKEREKE